MKKIILIMVLFTGLTFAQTDSVKTEIIKQDIEKQFTELKEAEKNIKLQLYELEQQLKAVITEQQKLVERYNKLKVKK